MSVLHTPKVPIMCFCTDKMYSVFYKPYIIYICLFASQFSKIKLTKSLLLPFFFLARALALFVRSSGTVLKTIFSLHSSSSKDLATEAVLRGFAAWNWSPAYSWLVSCKEQKLQTPPYRGNGIPGNAKVIPSRGLPWSLLLYYTPT